MFQNANTKFQIFLGPDHDHWCHIRRLENFTFDQQRDIAVPYRDGSDTDYERCEYFDLPYTNYTGNIIILQSALMGDTGLGLVLWCI